MSCSPGWRWTFDLDHAALVRLRTVRIFGRGATVNRFVPALADGTSDRTHPTAYGFRGNATTVIMKRACLRTCGWCSVGRGLMVGWPWQLACQGKNTSGQPARDVCQAKFDSALECGGSAVVGLPQRRPLWTLVIVIPSAVRFVRRRTSPTCSFAAPAPSALPATRNFLSLRCRPRTSAGSGRDNSAIVSSTWIRWRFRPPCWRPFRKPLPGTTRWCPLRSMAIR